ncbi:MAG: cupredoxin domain-containing protein [Gaiellaceae bacterium]
MSARFSAAALAAAALLLAGCGSEEEPPAAGSSAETFEIVETDFSLEPASVEIEEAGTYTFRAVNRGQAQHALELEGGGVEEQTKTIGPGESAELTAKLEAGEYELYCPVGDHKDRGMEGTVTVGGAAGGGGGDTGSDEDTEGDSPY